MPQDILTSDESDSEEVMIPAKESLIATRTSPAKAEEVDENDAIVKGDTNGTDEDIEEEGNEDDGEQEFIVEKILTHEWDAREKQWKYKTKWQDYDKEEDMTWEPEENLEGARESLEEYWEQVGKPDPSGPKGNKKRGRLSNSATSNSKKVRLTPEPLTTGRRGRKSDLLEDKDAWGPSDTSTWEPPKPTKDAWEEFLLAVETIEPDAENNRWAYLRWNVMDDEGRHRLSKHPLAQVYKAAPQAMLRFYEKHLVFSEKDKK